MAAVEIPVLYRDDHLIVVDKPARTLVVPAPGRAGRTVADALGAQLGARVYPVHRLDEDTTGALVLAVDAQCRPALEATFREHRAERLYLALTCRAPSPAAGRIESRLHQGRDGVMRSLERGAGERAVTHYRTVRRAGRFTLVECRLETGRRNQIRAHLSELGCEIAGDRKYGYRPRRGEKAVRRTMLHAARIRLPHPIDGETIDVECPLPPDFTRLAERDSPPRARKPDRSP